MQKDIINTLEIAAPGGKPTRVIKAPVAEHPESKREHKIVSQERDLEDGMVVLDEGTRRRNREFYEKLDAIDERSRKWEAKMRSEIQEREDAHKAVVADFEASLKEYFDLMKNKMDEVLGYYEDQRIPDSEARITGNEERFDEFVNVTVPRVVEEQSGAVTRRLQKAHDNFDIDNAKILKREKKILQRRENHFDNTAQGFEDESTTRIGKLWLLAEDIHKSEQTNAKQSEKLIALVMGELKDTKDRASEASKIRKEMDCLVLENLADTQHRCQKSVLDHFGEMANEV